MTVLKLAELAPVRLGFTIHKPPGEPSARGLTVGWRRCKRLQTRANAALRLYNARTGCG